jgi:DNA-binding response OmpR family regulator
LLVEEQADLRATMQDYLQSRGVDTFTARGVTDASELLPAIKPDIVAVDVDPVDGDAYALVERALELGASCIVVSGRLEVNDRVRALAMGVDGFVPKPVDLEELYLRVRNVLARRRSPEANGVSAILDLNGIKVDLVKRSVIGRGGHPDAELTETELEMLRMLSGSVDRLVAREAIYVALKGKPYQAASRALDVGVSRLRLKLKAAGAGVEIRSVRQAGWLLSREVASG